MLGNTDGWLLNAGTTTYKVKKGDALSTIARRYGTSVSAIKSANGLRSDTIRIGQRLTIPSLSDAAIAAGAAVHDVQSGDTLSEIATQYGISTTELKRANGLRSDMIRIGQKLIIPGTNNLKYVQDVAKTTARLRIRNGRWKYIVGHHSGIDRGNAESYHRNHLSRGMQNGLAYHFVIGNGIDSGDGQIEIGPRWHKQLDGGHVRKHSINQVGIGICVVGNFQERRPTQRQKAAFIELVNYLRTEVIGPSKFAVHKEIDGARHTVCPGRYFPTKEFHKLFPDA